MTAKRFAMAVDTRRCVGCSACMLACKSENRLPPGALRSWVVQEVRGSFPALSMQLRSERCGHCSDAPCVSACPTGASYLAGGGIVAVSRDRCTGCKACLAACPHGARTVHPDGYADKCTFCAHRVARGQEPACVDNCPAQALTFGDLADEGAPLSLLLRSRAHQTLRPQSNTHPNLFFIT